MGEFTPDDVTVRLSTLTEIMDGWCRAQQSEEWQRAWTVFKSYVLDDVTRTAGHQSSRPMTERNALYTETAKEMYRLRAENVRLREVLEDARLFAASSDCSCVIDTMDIAEHTPDCAVQAMAVKIDKALEATDDD